MAFQHVRFIPHDGLTRLRPTSPQYAPFEAAVRAEVHAQIERGDAPPPYTAAGHYQDVRTERTLHGLLGEFEASLRTTLGSFQQEPEHGGLLDGVGGFAVYSGTWRGYPATALLEWMCDPEDEHSILLLPGHLHLYLAAPHLQSLEETGGEEVRRGW